METAEFSGVSRCSQGSFHDEFETIIPRRLMIIFSTRFFRRLTVAPLVSLPPPRFPPRPSPLVPLPGSVYPRYPPENNHWAASVRPSNDHFPEGTEGTERGREIEGEATLRGRPEEGNRGGGRLPSAGGKSPEENNHWAEQSHLSITGHPISVYMAFTSWTNLSLPGGGGGGGTGVPGNIANRLVRGGSLAGQ